VWMGTTSAPVCGSGSWPAWISNVSSPSSHKTNNRRGDHPADVLERLRVEQSLEGLPACQRRGQHDHEHDEHARQVLSAAVSVCVPTRGGAPAQSEREPQRNGGKSV
jgi:hypothetical protein